MIIYENIFSICRLKENLYTFTDTKSGEFMPPLPLLSERDVDNREV